MPVTTGYAALFAECLRVLEHTFRRLEKQVPPPVPTRLHTGIAIRYREKSIEQALLQKLARQVSGLHAIRTLLSAGLVQEQCVIQRTLDEIGEDIQFLAIAAISGDLSSLHERYLSEFWEEEFDMPTAINSTQKRGMIPRQKIRAFVARGGGLDDPSSMNEVGRTIHKAYSGYVHAASPQIMDMCGGPIPPVFHIAGMLETPRIEDHTSDAANYFFRGILSARFVAKAFGDAQVSDVLGEYTARFGDLASIGYFKPKSG